jgi:hypothetical protein
MMAEFFTFLTTALGTPVDKLLIVAGLLFVGYAILAGYKPIHASALTRQVAAGVGTPLVVLGLAMYVTAVHTQAPTPYVVTLPASTPLALPTTSAPSAAQRVATPTPLPIFATATPVRLPVTNQLNADQLIRSIGRTP